MKPFDFTFTATDENGNRRFAILSERSRWGLRVVSREDILHRRLTDLVSAERAQALLPIVQRRLPKFEWTIVRFR